MDATHQPGVEEIQNAEFSRLVRFVGERFAARMPYVLVPLALLKPSVARVAVLVVGALVILGASRWVRHRHRHQDYTPVSVASNAMVTVLGYFLVVLTTGALGSPFTVGLVAFSVANGLLLGMHPARRTFTIVKVVLVWILFVVEALGWADPLAPSWLAPDPSLARAGFTACFLSLLVVGVSYRGAQIRGVFDRMLLRTVEARDQVLRTHQQQTEVLTAFTGAIAHELKNPLASVKGLAGLLAPAVPEGKPTERLSVLRREVDRMQGILDEFLNFSRPVVPLDTEEVDLRVVCDDVAALHEGLARERAVRIRVAGQGHAVADVRKTREVLINLVQNAIDASPAGGVVALQLAAEGGRARIDIDDDGPGLDPAVRERVFDAGVTTKRRGSGLGLTIARSLARQQGGELVLGARPGGEERGCRATLIVPTRAAG